MQQDFDLSEGIEEAIPLVIFNEEKKIFELNEEGRTYLQNLQAPLGIVAVAGMYRTGKSYLLNRMLLDRNEGGFGVGPTINPCTKGVWMWGKPIPGTTPEGDPINVIILDTEGLGALDEDSNHDVRIFSLAILLSSFFIYNSVGSIDENALQNLSLVINLTKHIQIKNSGIQEDVDPEEFAKYFPSFMWVVRDFTLQLVDQEGEAMTSKDYLEKALANQKGFSDSVEQKNRIRRLMKSFFSERDCVTMIRPLTDEGGLQALATKPMSDLRPEFVEQVTSLRRKVLGRIKPKKINGKPLNGTMLWNLMSSYVESINKGAIPSIESSWAYICKNECQKALDESYDIFQREMNEEMQNGGPFEDHEIKDAYTNAKKKAMQFFQKIAVGDIKEDFVDNLKTKMKNRYELLKQDNEHSCEQECIMFLRQSYTEIERALKNQQYPSFLDYLHDIEQFKQIFDESGPPGTNRKENLLDFCMKAIMESSEFFLGNLHNEMNLQKAIMEDTVRKLQEEIKELKTDQKQRIESLETKVRKAEIEKAEFSAKEQSTREALHQVQQEKTELENNLNGKLSQQKKNFEREITDINSKLSMVDDQKKEIQRAQTSAESEFDKQKALLDQKIEFLEKAVEDSNRREKEISTELKNSKKEFLNQNKEHTSTLDKQIKDQLKQLEELKETLYEQENKNTELEFQMEEFKNSLEIQNKNLNKELKVAKDQETDMNKKYGSLKNKFDNDSQNLQNQRANEKMMNDQRMVELETSLKETQESYEMAKQSWDKEKAVLNQKLEFVKYQLDDEKKKFEESKIAHDSMLGSLQSTSRESVIGREEAQSKINQQEEQFLIERKKQEEQYTEYRRKLTEQIEQLKKRNNELELERKIQDGEYEKDITNLKDQLTEADKERNDALSKLKNLDSQSLLQIQEREEKFKLREQELENQIEEQEKEIDELIQEHNEKSEKQLNELKKFYEDEKERLERRIQDEKTRGDKKLHQTVEDYEDKIQEMNNLNEDQLNQLEDEKNTLEVELQNLINQYEKENQVNHQQLENKERYINELKENIVNLQNSSSKQNESMSERFNRERKETSEKIEQLSMEVSKRDRAILSLENSKDSLKTQIEGRDKTNEELKGDLQSEKLQLHQKIDELKQKYETAMDELTQSKINFEREKALKDQRLSFQEQRIQEYHDQMNQSIDRYEERLKQEKEDNQKTLHERIARIQQEKENVETKYEQKRKALKELEKQMQIVQSQFEREKAVQMEKYENLERSQNDLIKTYEAETQKLQEQNNQLNDALSQGEIGIREQLEQWKSQYYEMERLHADLQSELEKEKALWEGKFDFLEKQKEQLKKDNEEALRQFQQTVDQLQKSQNENKQKNEHNHGVVMQQMEQKFKKELKDREESHQSMQNQLNNTIRRLEKENKSINERLELNSKSLISEAGGLEKRLERITDEKDRLKDECDNVKTERDRKLDDLKRQFDREKEVIKQKNIDLQQKNKQTEAKQTELILSHETNRAKWDQEKSYLISAKEDAISELKNIQKRYENSVKEIERLKEQQKRNNWRMTNKERVGGIATNNPLMYKVGEGMLGRLNLGGAGGGLNRQSGNEVSMSQNNLNLGKGDMGTFRSNLVDKSMDNFKIGFSQNFGSQLGLGQSKLGGNNMGDMSGTNRDAMSGANRGAAQTFGAVIQPKTGGDQQNQSMTQAMGNNNNALENSMRQSNILSTPSSKGAHEDDYDK